MKCPYQTKTIHIPETKNITGITEQYAQDITSFCDCLKNECPFYYTTEYKPARIIKEHCKRGNKEKKQ